jgi:hypothetical protein
MNMSAEVREVVQSIILAPFWGLMIAIYTMALLLIASRTNGIARVVLMLIYFTPIATLLIWCISNGRIIAFIISIAIAYGICRKIL